MLSYMVPVDEKPPPIPGKDGLALELLDAHAQSSPQVPPRRAKAKAAISKESSTCSFASDLTISSSTPTAAHDKPRHKLLSNGTKHPPLKRVSFGSSKGSMVETLIYESPLQEVPETSPPAAPLRPQETTFLFTVPADDESERSKVRVCFYQGARPQCVSPPAPDSPPAPFLPPTPAAMADHAAYNRQVSTESGWDNPFRPDGDLSREADEIVSLIKGGKPITPTPLPADEHDAVAHNVSVATESSPQTKSAAQSPKAMNGTKNGAAALEARPGPVEVQRQAPPQPQQAEHVTIKKKPKCQCCALQ